MLFALLMDRQSYLPSLTCNYAVLTNALVGVLCLGIRNISFR